MNPNSIHRQLERLIRRYNQAVAEDKAHHDEAAELARLETRDSFTPPISNGKFDESKFTQGLFAERYRPSGPQDEQSCPRSKDA